MRRQKGSSLIEAAVALALMGIIGVAFLGGLATTSRSRSIVDQQATARTLAESQMEDLKKQTYAFSYDAIPIPPEYPGYVSIINVDNLRNGNIQQITITIRHHNSNIFQLESYKVNR